VPEYDKEIKPAYATFIKLVVDNIRAVASHLSKRLFIIIHNYSYYFYQLLLISTVTDKN
jgi:hypothetical protein